MTGLQRVRPLLDRMAAVLRPVLRESVTPISVVRGDQTAQFGTGTFFRVADSSFVVTASHVWEEATRTGDASHLCVFGLDGRVEGGDRLRPVPFAGKVRRLPDPLDVAVLELDA